jgi:hypothetical protein
LGAFRRARRAQAESYKDNRKEWNIVADSDKIKVVPLKQNTIKSITYENKFSEILPANIVHSITVKAREILRENNRKRAETVYLMSIENGDVAYKHHDNSLEFSIDVGKINHLPDDSLVLIHNHPSGNSFSIYDLRTLIYNNKIHTMIAVTPNGKIYSLRIKNRNINVDKYAESMYYNGVDENKPLSQIFKEISKNLDWEYNEYE